MHINWNDEKISNMKKYSFKKWLKKNILDKAFEILSEKKNTHSKMDETQYYKFVIQNYLKSDSCLKNIEKYLLLKFRTRMAEVKVNFKGKYEDLLCPLCNIKQDSQSHLFNWNGLI